MSDESEIVSSDIGSDLPAEQGSRVEPASAPDDPELSSLLDQFEGRSKPAAEAPAPTMPATTTTDLDADRRFLQLAMQSDQQRDLLQRLLQHNLDQSAAYEQQQRIRQESADFEEVVAEASEALEGMPVAEDYARRWFLAEVQLNPMLRETWEHRRDSPELQRRAVQVLHREIRRMVKEVGRIPDLSATEDRAAVTAAVRGAGRAPPAENSGEYERRVANMNSVEFDKEMQRLGM